MDNHGQWLKDNLEEWTKEGLVTPDAAEVLRERYGRGSSFSWTAPLFAAALICLAAGLILTGAGLWSTLTQDERFLLAVGPLVASDLLAALFLMGDSAARRIRRHRGEGTEEPRGLPYFLREGVGIFHGLAVSAAVWMVHDSFLLDGDMSGLLAAAALSLLLMLYILRSAGLGIIFSADAALAAWLNPVGGWLDGAAWLLLAAAFPFFFFLIGSKRQVAGIAYAWGWIASVLALTFVTASGQIWQAVFFANVASLTWLIGAALRSYGWIGAAFRFIGGAAVFAVLFAAAFGAAWRDAEGGWFLWILLVVFLAADGVLLAAAAVRREWLSITAGLTPFVMAAAVVMSLWDPTGVSSAVLVTCFMVFLAMSVVLRGVQKGRSWQIASGLLLLLCAGGVRLWDSSLSFAQRGTFFFAAGIMAAALCLLFRPRRKKRRTKAKRVRTREPAPEMEPPVSHAERTAHEEPPVYKPAGPWAAPSPGASPYEAPYPESYAEAYPEPETGAEAESSPEPPAEAVPETRHSDETGGEDHA